MRRKKLKRGMKELLYSFMDSMLNLGIPNIAYSLHE
jgi:hypothetical protein